MGSLVNGLPVDREALAKAQVLLTSRFVDKGILGKDLEDPILYAVEFLDLYHLMSNDERLLFLPIFDYAYYERNNPDVAASGINCLVHFLSSGLEEFRSPHPLVDLHHMRKTRWDIFDTGISIFGLVDAIERNLVDPAPYFSVADYSGMYANQLDDNTSRFLHFLKVGASQGAKPNAFLDPEYYADLYDDVPQGGLEATVHYVEVGDKLGRSPSAAFDPRWYMLNYKDSTPPDAVPLRHFLTVGRLQGRAAAPSALERIRKGPDRVPVPTTRLWKPDENPAYLLRSHALLTSKLTQRMSDRRSKFAERSSCPVQVGKDVQNGFSELEFQEFDVPSVDILIPCFNEFAFTVECLLSIQRAEIGHAYRVYIADDASTDPQVRQFADVKGLVYLRSETNRHFLRNCNWSYRSTTAKYVLLFNNDAQLTPGCLDELVKALEEDHTAAAAVPMVLYPNGRLQEAGCAIRSDGSTVMVGVGENPDNPQFNWAREVQYGSGACILFRRTAVTDELFDEHFAPAYCEDADLCMRMRKEGHSIVYIPSARVVHHLSVSTSKQSAVRRLQLVKKNQGKFYGLWSKDLARDNQVRVLSFYLPQFHPVPQNDLWWGKGFTEWANVVKAAPSYAGHYQPHLPSDLGYYDLRITEIMGQQQQLARRYGLDGFVVYYYNFGAQRILETPLERLLSKKDIDFRFCICWANENWTRHWDGGEKSILLEQLYDEETLESVAADAIRFAEDSRAIRIRDKPLFLVYRPMRIPEVANVMRLFRQRFDEAGFPGTYFIYVESMEAVSAGIKPSDIGFDASVEFPPHGIAGPYRSSLEIFKEGWDGKVYDYGETAINSVLREGVAYKRYPTVFPSWDNTARQPLTGTTLQGASPELFEAVVDAKLDQVESFFVGEERLLFVNAWNEWAEGAHLEPDHAYGHRWLSAIRNALVRRGFFQ